MSNDRTEIVGLTDTEAVLSRLAWHLIRDTNRLMGDHAQDVEARARARAAQVGGVARMAAGSLKSKRSTGGDGGSVLVGGGSRLPTGSGSYSDVFFGAEWGGGSRPTTHQFKPWQPDGYWFYPAVRETYRARMDTNVEVLQQRAMKLWAS